MADLLEVDPQSAQEIIARMHALQGSGKMDREAPPRELKVTYLALVAMVAGLAERRSVMFTHVPSLFLLLGFSFGVGCKEWLSMCVVSNRA
jgi:hypothetical protein